MKIDARGHINKDATPEQRLRHHGWFIDENGCWIWLGKTKHKFGYGQLRILGKGREAHTVAYETWVGNIPKGMQVRHICDVPACINPEHLVLGTSQDNHNDMVTRGRALVGDKNPMAKLLPVDVEQIKLDYARGESQSSIAKRFEISQSNVSMIVHNKRWKVMP